MSESAKSVRESKPGEIELAKAKANGALATKTPATFVPIPGNQKLLLATFAGLTLGGLTLGGVVWARRAKRRKESARTEDAPGKTSAAKA